MTLRLRGVTTEARGSVEILQHTRPPFLARQRRPQIPSADLQNEIAKPEEHLQSEKAKTKNEKDDACSHLHLPTFLFQKERANKNGE